MHLPRSGRLAVSLILFATAWHAGATTADARVTTFDKHVSAGLPQAFSLPVEDGQTARRVLVARRLNSDVVLPDGNHATLYTGNVAGQEAVFSRTGETLNISVDEPAEGKLTRSRRAAALANRSPTPPENDDDPAGPDALRFWIFLHDRAGEPDYAKFHHWYLGWWIKDMETAVRPGVAIKVILQANVPGITDLDCMNAKPEALYRELLVNARKYAEARGERPDRLTKYMLFVGDRPTRWRQEGTYGESEALRGVAMATGWGPRHIVAHEFGHLLDARHEYAETRWCVTNMKDYTIGFVSCRYYSRRNDDQIRAYVRRALEP